MYSLLKIKRTSFVQHFFTIDRKSRHIFSVTFVKPVSANETRATELNIGITKTGPLIPYLTVGNLHNLLAWNSNPNPSLAQFTKEYRDFVRDEKNSHFITNDNISFGRGSRKKVILNADGLIAFSKANTNKFQFCTVSVNNLITACLNEIDRIQSGTSELKSRILSNRFFEIDTSQVPIVALGESLESGILQDSNSFNYAQLGKVLSSTNTFYILRLEDNWFRAGASVDIFKKRLRSHPAFNSKNFVEIYCIFLFKTSELLDAYTLENDFF